MFLVLRGCLSGIASNTIDSFDPFSIFGLTDFLLTPAFFQCLRGNSYAQNQSNVFAESITIPTVFLP